MTKPHLGKPDFPSPEGASPEGPTMENLQHTMIEQFEKRENKMAMKDCISNLVKIEEEQNNKISILEDKIVIMDSHISMGVYLFQKSVNQKESSNHSRLQISVCNARFCLDFKSICQIYYH